MPRLKIIAGIINFHPSVNFTKHLHQFRLNVD